MEKSYIQVLRKHYKELALWGGKLPDIDAFDEKDTESCERFIERVFALFGKIQGNHLLSLLSSVDEDRKRHIVYTFLLGVAIYKESDFVRRRVDGELDLYKEALVNQKDGFEFVWFLICLFHDLAYPIEDEGKKCEITCYQELADRFKSYLLEELIGMPLLYQGMLSRYFDYKRMLYRKPECDHGIYAGLYMYNYLCKNRVARRAKNGNAGLWNPALNRLYRFAASIVACHNIWLQPYPNDMLKYIYCGMQPLIAPRGSRPIRFYDYPTFFLFCLVDSIEMVKRKDVTLDKLKMDIRYDGILLDINECSQTDKYILRYYFLAIDDWLTDAKETEDGIITISIK